jgi:hypothetical protein
MDFIQASANLKQEIELLNKLSSEIQMMEEELAKKMSQAKEKDLPLVEDLAELRQQIEFLREKLNLRLDEQEPVKTRMRRKALQRRLDLLEYSLGEEKVRNSEEKLTFWQTKYLQALGIPDISYEDLEFSQYISRTEKDKLSEADMMPYFEKGLIEEFTQSGAGTAYFLYVKDPIDYYRWPPEVFIPWAKDIPAFVSSAYKQTTLYEKIASTLKEKSLELQSKGYSTIAIILHFNADGETVFFLPRKSYDPKAGKLYPNLNRLEFLYPPPDHFLAKIREDTISDLNRALSELKRLEKQSGSKHQAQHIRTIMDELSSEFDSLKKRFSSIYYKWYGSPYGNYNIKKRLGEKYQESWEDLGIGLNPWRTNIFDTSVAARYGIQAYLLEVDNLENTSPSRMKKIVKRLVENYKQVVKKLAQEQGKSFEEVKNATALLFIPGESPTDPNQAFAEFNQYKELAKKIKEKDNLKLEQLSQKIEEYEEIKEAKLELEKLNLERKSLIYVEEDNLKMKHRIDKLTFAARLNEEILELKDKIATGKDRINQKKLLVYHKYNIDSPYLPLGIVSYKAKQPLSGIFFTLSEGYLLYSGVKEKDGYKIGLGCILTLLEFLHNRKVAFEYNQDLSRKLGIKLEKDKISVSVSLKLR